MASSPAVTCSPEATTASYSRGSYSWEASRTQATSWLVVPDMAETTTATLLPASTSRFTWRATLRMRSTLATEVPPNFITIKAIATSGSVAGSASAPIDRGDVSPGSGPLHKRGPPCLQPASTAFPLGCALVDEGADALLSIAGEHVAHHHLGGVST